MATSTRSSCGFELQRDAWLEAILQRPCARLSLLDSNATSPDALRAAIEDSYWCESSAASRQFIDAKIDTANTAGLHLLNDVGLKVVDVNLTFERMPDRLPQTSAAGSLREVHRSSSATSTSPVAIRVISANDPSMIRQVIDISRRSFRYSRFHLDPLIEPALADQIKADWIANCLHGQRGDLVWGAFVDSTPVGFLASIQSEDSTASRTESTATIDLIAVDPKHRGKGVAALLSRSFVDHYSKNSAATSHAIDKEHHHESHTARLRVGTQVANLAACRLYQALGFRPIQSTYVLHGHIDRSGKRD